MSGPHVHYLNIKRLDVSNNPIGDSGMKLLVPFLAKSKHVVSLCIADVGLTHEGSKYIFVALRTNQSLAEIDFASSNVSNCPNRIGKQGAKQLANFIIEAG